MRALGKTLAISMLLITASVALAAHQGACPTSAGMKDASQATKPSSFQPRPRPPGNAYGTPIGDKILSKRVKKKKPASPTARPA